jgi:hypothetical protein
MINQVSLSAFSLSAAAAEPSYLGVPISAWPDESLASPTSPTSVRLLLHRWQAVDATRTSEGCGWVQSKSPSNPRTPVRVLHLISTVTR